MALKTNGKTIRVLRKTLGISQVALATRAGISRSHLCKIELGAYEPTVEMTRRIADQLGVSLDVITYPVPEPESAAS